MATAFSYSGTGLESAIQSGSGGIGTGSSITLEVDAVPSDLSQGDTVKVALGSASDWSGGNGETAYGDIGSAGANGGTNITLTDRGQEGTSAASWSDGDSVRVGVQGRDNASFERSVVEGFYPTAAISSTANTTAISGQTLLHHGLIRKRISSPTFHIFCSSSGSTDGVSRFVVYEKDGSVQIISSVVDLSSSGIKSISTSKTFPQNEYLIGISDDGNYSTQPKLRFADFSQSAGLQPVKDVEFNDAAGYRIGAFDPSVVNLGNASSQSQGILATYYN